MNDHGFSKVCKGGNIMAQLFPNPPRIEDDSYSLIGFCKECGKPLDGDLESDFCALCQARFDSEDR